MPQSKKLIYNTTTALGADLTTDGNMVYITGAAGGEQVSFNINNIISAKSRQVRVAGTAQVTTVAITAANSVLYKLAIKAVNVITGGNSMIFEYSYLSDPSATAAEICNALLALINADPRIPVAATNVANDLVLTGETPYFIFTSYNANPNVTTLTFTATTPGVVGQGTGSLLIASPYNDSNLVSTNNYTAFFFNVELTSPRDAYGLKKETQEIIVFVNEAATNYESFAGVYGTLTQTLQRMRTTYSAGTGTLAATAATDILTLAGGGEFAAQNIVSGDVVFQDGETTYYLVNNVLSTTTANSVVTVDNAAAAYTIVKIRKF
jgi:hypothetical protein